MTRFNKDQIIGIFGVGVLVAVLSRWAELRDKVSSLEDDQEWLKNRYRSLTGEVGELRTEVAE